jgi:hypothetical protein
MFASVPMVRWKKQSGLWCSGGAGRCRGNERQICGFSRWVERRQDAVAGRSKPAPTTEKGKRRKANRERHTKKGRRRTANGERQRREEKGKRQTANGGVANDRVNGGDPGGKKNGAPGEIRTPDPLLRRQLLYPAELRARKVQYNALREDFGWCTRGWCTQPANGRVKSKRRCCGLRVNGNGGVTRSRPGPPRFRTSAFACRVAGAWRSESRCRFVLWRESRWRRCRRRPRKDCRR